jgi:hypothetical protein
MNAVLDRSAARDVEAVINYTRKSEVRPVNYTFDPPPGVPRYSGENDSRSVLIRDAREARGLSLDVNGFELLQHDGTLHHWDAFRDDQRVRTVDYPEVTAAVRAHTGADKVVIFDHTLRDSSVAPGHATLRDPVRRVHDDQTFESAPRRVSRHLTAEEAAWRLKRRFAIINFWRPIGGPVRRSPLAICDARTIEQGDLIASDLVYPDWVGETYGVAYNSNHTWYWYPRQQVWEATLLKIYDSATDGRARLTAHTAFELPESSAAVPRRSIEIRLMLFW